MLSTFIKIFSAFFLDSAVLGCNIGSEDMDCCNNMIQAGIDLESFGKSVAHGIHSITIDHVKAYFDIVLPENNSIPTVSSNFQEGYILNHAPKLSSDNEIKSLSMKSLDFILSNNDNINEFYISDLTHLEKLAHAAHMDELWTMTKKVYERIRKSTSYDGRLCECLTMERETKVIGNLITISIYLRNYGLIRPKVNDHKRLPSLSDSDSWKKWKMGLKLSMPSQKDVYHIAFYLFCKLRQYAK